MTDLATNVSTWFFSIVRHVVALRHKPVVIALVMALAIHVVEFKGWLAGAEGQAADWYLKRRSGSALNIVTIAIDDDDYRDYFKEHSPLDAEALMKLVVAVQNAAPRVVGVDILTDSHEYTDSKYEGAGGLNTAIEGTQARTVPVVWAAEAHVPEGAPEPWFLSWLFQHEEFHLIPGARQEDGAVPREVLPGRMRMKDPMGWFGVPLFPLERDRAVRRVPRIWTDTVTGRQQLTFAGRVAWLYCKSGGNCPLYRLPTDAHEDIFVSYGPTSPAPSYRIRDLFTCEAPQPALESTQKGPKEPRFCFQWKWKYGESPKALANSIVLIGGTFHASNDSFAAPIQSPVFGLLLNAQAVRAEMAGPLVKEWPRWVTLLLDAGVGLLIALIFSSHVHAWIARWLRPTAQDGWHRRADHVMWRVGATLGLGLIVYATSWCVFSQWQILWLSWVGMLLVGLAWHIAFAETRHMRMKAEP